MKKLSVLAAVFFAAASLFAFTQNDIRTFTLENGLTLYFLQDTTTATVRLELNIKAGTTSSSADNGALFYLAAKLSGLEMTPDVVKKEIITSPARTENALIELSQAFKPVSVSNSVLKSELNAYKAQLVEFESSAAGFINGAIDSRVFPEHPWKQESGVNPADISSKTTEEVRTELDSLKNVYYTPENACLYISGNITDSSALALTEKYFGKASERFSKNAAEPDSSSAQAAISGENKAAVQKYVLTDDELSSDLTQIVLQFRDFNQDQADLLAAVFNNPASEFKRLLMKQRNLAIRAADYIDASSAQQSNSSRLLLQSLLEKTKVSPVVQAELFLQMATEKDRVLQAEVDFAVKNMTAAFETVSDNSTLLMKNLAVFNQTNKEHEETLFNKNERLASYSAEKLNLCFEAARPAVFVLCSTENFTKYAKDFKKAGYTQITSKNGVWYRQQKYQSVLAKNKKPVNKTSADTDMALSAERFIAENKEQFTSFELQNKIPVTIKYTPNSRTAAVSLAIEGGELLFADKDAGLSAILVNALASIIQWQLDGQCAKGLMKNSATVSAWTGAQYSLLTITCAAEDVPFCLNSAAASIIFGDINPALADGISYDLRTQWRLKTGSPDFQLLCEAVRTIYSKPFTNLYADTKDKPVQMEFTDIAAAYPIILDCTRFALVITGGVQNSESLKAALENSFGTLGTVKATESIKRKVEKKSLPVKAKHIQLRHQFFTDISADKAGPRPAVLIPTTDFSDPLLYVLECPDISSTDCALFSALLYEIKDRLQKKVSGEQVVKVTAPDSDLPYGQIVVTKVKSYSKIDNLYAQCVQELLTDLEELINACKDDSVIDLEKPELLSRIESLWLLNELEGTGDNAGTARLIQKGRAQGNPELYLDMYNAVSKAQAEDYYLVAKMYLSETPFLRLYSSDTKK